MPAPGALLFFYDYVDPASYLLDLRLRERGLEAAARDAVPGPDGQPAGEAAADTATLEPRPFEIRRPPRPMVDPGDARWTGYLETMAAEADRLGALFRPPALVPWTHKAHELALHAREKGCFGAVHRALFGAHFADGRDIGRVDVLVALAAEAGLERSETKAVLDVDRHAHAVAVLREEAERSGVRGVPTLRDAAGTRVLEGYPDDDTLDGFLRGS